MGKWVWSLVVQVRPAPPPPPPMLSVFLGQCNMVYFVVDGHIEYYSTLKHSTDHYPLALFLLAH